MVDEIDGTLKVLSPKDCPTPPTPIPGHPDEHVSLMVCAAANGDYPHPMAILPLETLPHLSTYTNKFLAITGQHSGWMTRDIFVLWVKNVYLPWINELRIKYEAPTQRILLTLDQHGSRDDQTILKLLYDNCVDVHFIEPHSSTICQAMDLEVFLVFKSIFSRHLDLKDIQSKPNRRYIILDTAIKSLLASLSLIYVETSFQKAGLVPFNPEIPLHSSLIKRSSLYPDEINEKIPPKSRKRGPKITNQIVRNGQQIN